MRNEEYRTPQSLVTNRRGFLRMAGGFVLAGAALGFSDLAAADPPGTASRRGHPARLDRLDREAFHAQAGTDFHFVTPGGTVALTLVEAQDRRRADRGPGATGECFALRFEGPARTALEQDTYRVEHDALGTFDLFIVPGGNTRAVRRYEALFNRTTG